MLGIAPASAATMDGQASLALAGEGPTAATLPREGGVLGSSPGFFAMAFALLCAAFAPSCFDSLSSYSVWNFINASIKPIAGMLMLSIMLRAGPSPTPALWSII